MPILMNICGRDQQFTGSTGVACSLQETHLSKTAQLSQAQVVTTVQSVCITLRFFACGTFLYSVGDAEGLAKAVVRWEIRRVYFALKHFLSIFVYTV